MMMNKKLKLATLFMLMVVSLIALTQFTYAWLTDTNTFDNIRFSMGKIKYVLVTSEVPSTTPIVPNQELLVNGGYKLRNESSVDSELRIKISYNYVTGVSNNQPIISSDFKDFTSDNTTSPANLNKELIGSIPSSFVYSPTDKAWYYVLDNNEANPSNVGSLAGENQYIVPRVIDGQTATPFTFLTSLKYNGLVVNNTYQGAVLTIKITFEAKQAKYVTWQELGSFDIVTG